jgi:hypothetical protein
VCECCAYVTSPVHGNDITSFMSRVGVDDVDCFMLMDPVPLK